MFVCLLVFVFVSIGYMQKNNLSQKILYSKTKHSASGLSHYPKNFPGAVLITDDNEIVPFVGHAGIIINSRQIIESSCFEGVHYGPNDWDIAKKTCYCSIPNKFTKQKCFLAANWSQNQIGKSYNYNFFDWRNTKTNKFYCSQIIWTAYQNSCQKDLVPAHPLILLPLEFISSPETKIIYLKDAYHEKK